MINIIFYLTCILFLLSACSIQPLAYRGYDTFEITNLSGDPSVKTNIRLYNPNKTGARIKETELSVLINNKELGQIRLTEPVKMKSQEEFVLPFTLQTSYPKLAAIAISDLGGFLKGGEVPYKVEGYFLIQKCLFKKKFAFVFEDELQKEDLKY